MHNTIPREYHLDLHCTIMKSTITAIVAGCVICDASKTRRTFILATALLASEDEGNAFLQNISNHSPSDSVTHPRRLESSAAPF